VFVCHITMCYLEPKKHTRAELTVIDMDCSDIGSL